MPDNCGHPDGQVHQHAERCYRAGITNGQAHVKKLIDDWARDFDDTDTVTIGSVVCDLRSALEAGDGRG